MRIAIPLANNQLCMHFGHSEEFLLAEVDSADKRVVRTERLTPPPHQPGVLPQWLHEHGVDLIIAGGMGRRAQQLFHTAGIQVLVGVRPEAAEKILADYLAGRLPTGENPCDHGICSI